MGRDGRRTAREGWHPAKVSYGAQNDLIPGLRNFGSRLPYRPFLPRTFSQGRRSVSKASRSIRTNSMNYRDSTLGSGSRRRARKRSNRRYGRYDARAAGMTRLFPAPLRRDASRPRAGPGPRDDAGDARGGDARY